MSPVSCCVSNVTCHLSVVSPTATDPPSTVLVTNNLHSRLVPKDQKTQTISKNYFFSSLLENNIVRFCNISDV